MSDSYKVILVGPRGVGKTSLFMKQKMGYFDIDSVEPSTQVQSFFKTITLDEEGAPERRSSVARSGSMREGSIFDSAVQQNQDN